MLLPSLKSPPLMTSYNGEVKACQLYSNASPVKHFVGLSLRKS